MAELIDRDKCQERIFRFAKRLVDWGFPKEAEAVRAVAKGIKLEKTVDAVEVVRCKYCEKWHRHTMVDRDRGDCRRYETTKHENGYCDRGKRRTDG